MVKKLYPFPVCMEICQLPLPRIDGNQDRLFKHSEYGEYKVKKAYQIIQQSACSSVISSERPFGIPHHLLENYLESETSYENSELHLEASSGQSSCSFCFE